MMQDENLERGIIAAMANDDQSLRIYLSLLKEEHFQNKSLCEDFRSLKAGRMVQADIRDMVIENHEYYSQIVKELYTKTQIYKACQAIGGNIQNGKPLDEVISDIQTLQNGTASTLNFRGLTIAEIEQRQQHTKTFEYLYNKHDFIDFYDNAGSHKGQTEVIFGHPKHGKTAYAIYRASGYLKQGYKGLYITMEDTHIGIKDKFERQLGSDHDYKHKLFVGDRSLGTKDLDDVCKFMRYHKIVDNIDFCVVDYIQRIPVRGLSARDETMKVLETSNRITDLANELDLLILVLAQPHRIEKIRRGYNMFPEVYDLHGSSAIEKDAFVATAVFRPNQNDELCDFNHESEIISVRDPAGDGKLHKNTIFARQRVNRQAERSTKWLQLIHTDWGLQAPYYEKKGENYG